MYRLARPHFVALTTSLCACLVLTACNRAGTDTLSSAYVAPATLNLRPEVTQKGKSVAVLQHGERVLIVDVRRRFVKVRTLKGAEGWVDGTELLREEKMAQVQRDTEIALHLSSEGVAGVFEPLNVHIEPSRQSPVFVRVLEGESAEVLGHKLEPKVQGSPKAPNFNVQRPQFARKSDRTKTEATTQFPFPKIDPPKVPANLEELSRGAIEPAPQPAPAPKQEAAAKPVVMEDWTLVRTRDRKVGWVLTRNLVMSIPDDVAQYAEGRRITSYFSLGTVNDEEKGRKNNWLWTTASEQETCDFDAWRVFLWNRKRHRYETSYREHGVEGYFPVQVQPGDQNASERTFQLIMRDDAGKLFVHTYGFDGVRVHGTGTEPYDPGRPAAGPMATTAGTEGVQTKKPSRLSAKLQKLKKRLAKPKN
jgi:hypothetical protein